MAQTTSLNGAGASSTSSPGVLQHPLAAAAASSHNSSRAAASSSADICLAVAAGDAQQVAALLESGADINTVDEQGNHPLGVAVQQLSEETLSEMLNVLLAKPSAISLEVFAATLRMAAARGNHPALVRLLSVRALAQLAINIADDDGCSALHCAASADSGECVRLLLQVPGVDPDITARDGFTPLHQAVLAPGSQLQALDAMLMSVAARCNRSPAMTVVSRDVAAGSHPVVSCEDVTPLHAAVSFSQCSNRQQAVRLLVSAGADMRARASCLVQASGGTTAMVGGFTPLHFAASVPEAGIEGLDELLQSEAQAATRGGSNNSSSDVTPLVQLVDDLGFTPVHRAVMRSNIAAVKRLLQAPGCNPAAPNHKGWTPLHVAAQYSAAAVEVLLAQGSLDEAAVNVRTDGGLTPLHVAAYQARENPEARAALGVLLASDKVDTSLTVSSMLGADGDWSWEDLLSGEAGMRMPSYSSTWSRVLGNVLGKLESGAGQLLFSIYLLTVLSGFGDSMSSVLFWLSWLLLAVDACLVYAVRPLVDALKRRAVYLGISGRVWCLEHMQTSYIVSKLVIISVILVQTLTQAETTRMQAAMIMVSLLALAMEGCAFVGLHVFKVQDSSGQQQHSILYKLRHLFPVDVVGAALGHCSLDMVMAGELACGILQHQLYMTIATAGIGVLALCVEAIRAVAFSACTTCYMFVDSMQLWGVSSLSLPAAAAEEWADKQFWSDVTSNAAGELITYASDALTTMHVITFGLLIGGSFGSQVSLEVFWVCWFLVLVDVGISSIHHLRSFNAAGRMAYLIRPGALYQKGCKINVVVESLHFFLMGPLAGALLALIMTGHAWDPSDESSGNGRGREVLVVIAVLTTAQALSAFLSWLVLPGLVLNCCVLLLVIIVLGFVLGTFLFLLLLLCVGASKLLRPNKQAAAPSAAHVPHVASGLGVV